jgi:hypothetical protein
MEKATFNRWYKTLAHAYPIDNSSGFRTFLSKIKNFHKVHSITKDNRMDFKKIWGKPDTYWTNSEFYFHVWIKEYKDELFIILTAKGKGTCIEICNTSFKDIDEKSKTIMLFINDLCSKLKGDSMEDSTKEMPKKHKCIATKTLCDFCNHNDYKPDLVKRCHEKGKHYDDCRHIPKHSVDYNSRNYRSRYKGYQ